MPKFEQRVWPGDPTGQSRKDREPFRYEAYVPDRIAEADFPLTGPTSVAVSEAERSVSDLNQDPPTLHALEAVARQLLRAESVASSRIEGLELSHKRLARAAYESDDGHDATARSVLGNVKAMERAIAIGAADRPLTVDDIIELHRVLMEATTDAHIAGRVRDKQNWIGGGTFSPRNAEFIPPPPEYVDGLLEDLAFFLNRADLPTIQQAAIAHAQFETIHPFADGNGRVGRCLIHVVLRRRDLAPRYVPPISLVLAAHADDYIKGLTAYRRAAIDEWCLFFAQVASSASHQAVEFATRISELQEEWRQRVKARRGSGADLLIQELPGQPLIDVETAEQLIGGSAERARLALNRLADAGVVQPAKVSSRRGQGAGRPGAVWEVQGLFEALNSFERDLAVPEGGDEPARPTPSAMA